jgi:hypothetical protein
MESERQQVLQARTHLIGAGILFILASVGAVAAIHLLQLRGWALAVAISVPLAAYVYFIRETNRRGTATGCVSPAQVRYNRRMGLVTIVYVAVLVAAVWVANTYRPTGPLLWMVAILPAVPVIGMIAAMLRLLVEETDEYLKFKTARLALIATGFMLAVTTVWGFLETFGLVPHVPAYAAFVVWCAGLGVGTCVHGLRSS